MLSFDWLHWQKHKKSRFFFVLEFYLGVGFGQYRKPNKIFMFFFFFFGSLGSWSDRKLFQLSPKLSGFSFFEGTLVNRKEHAQDTIIVKKSGLFEVSLSIINRLVWKSLNCNYRSISRKTIMIFDVLLAVFTFGHNCGCCCLNLVIVDIT